MGTSLWGMADLEAAIEALYHSRYSGFRHGAAAVLGDREAAHDAVQDGFAQALRSRGQFRGGSLEAWVWRIVLRKALDLRRGASALPLEAELDDAILETGRDPDLAAAVRSLPPRRRLVVFLRYYADLPYEEIGRVCSISEGTVAATLARAHADLRRLLTTEEVPG